MTRTLILVLLLVFATPADARSSGERMKFRKKNPCPATQSVRGACPGWEIDHIEPLHCGGADRPYNMQWLTVAAHRAKTREQRGRCPVRPPITQSPATPAPTPPN